MDPAICRQKASRYLGLAQDASDDSRRLGLAAVADEVRGAKIVAVQSGNTVKIGFVFVALLACFNAAGRVVAGVVSDYVGRVVTIGLVCVFQALAMFLFSNFTSIGGFVVGAAVVGFSYGACLSLFPATVADAWGTKNLGLNYGILFTAWGVGGVFGP